MSHDAQLVAGRKALIGAVVALRAQLDSLVLVGAQAIYLYTGDADVEVATTTKDSDIAVLPELLMDTPRLEEAMRVAGFELDERGLQGQWLGPERIQVDLLVAEGKREPGAAECPGVRAFHPIRKLRRAMSRG